jgi:hypothetical protein
MGAAIITHGNAPPVLEAPEQVFNFVPLLVEFLVVSDLDDSKGSLIGL